jgi:PAS domain S-box-containing protein
MQKIPVTRDGKLGSKIIILNADEVLKIESRREREYVVHTREGQYYFQSSLEAFEEWLYEEGFRLIDQGNVVNMNHVTHYMTGRGLVYFGDPQDKNTKTATAARIHKDHILNLMEMLKIANNHNDGDPKQAERQADLFQNLLEQHSDDRFMRSYATIRAIYEKKRAEKRLAESEQRYKSLFEHNPDAICSFDPHGIFVSVNPATEKITGYAAELLLNRPFSDVLITREEEERWREHFEQTLKGSTQYYEIRIQHKDGHPVEMSMINIPIVIDNEITGVYMIGKDITERKRSEELLLKSEKLSIVGQLAAGVAHEIRNPLTSLKGFVQLLNSRIDGYKDYFNIMLNELDRINFIVSEFLVIAKPQAVQYERKDIAIILLNTIALINTQAIMNNVQIVSEFHSDIPLILCDENQLKQVFINILNNSIEAMPNGGEIKIEVRNLEGKEILIRFIDQGCGIPENRIPRLGEPFYTTKEKGTGLGLMVSYKIIENHRGKINITSEVNKGTTVDIILPV